MSVEMKNAIQMGHFANLGALAATIADGDRTVHVIGYVVGKARGISYRANPNGDEPSKGVVGMFEATPTEMGRSLMRSSLVFFPSSFVKMVEDALQIDPKEVPKKAPAKGKAMDLEGIAELPIAVEIGIRKNTGAGVGYEFAVTMLTPDDKAGDALADVRAYLPKQIAQMSPAPALPAPASAAKGKTKKK